MGNSRRGALVALAVSVAALIAGICDDGRPHHHAVERQRDGFGHASSPRASWSSTLPDVTTPLRTGDVVVAMDGRSTRLVGGRVAAPPAEAVDSVGDVVPFEVVRDGGPGGARRVRSSRTRRSPCSSAPGARSRSSWRCSSWAPSSSGGDPASRPPARCCIAAPGAVGSTVPVPARHRSARPDDRADDVDAHRDRRRSTCCCGAG